MNYRKPEFIVGAIVAVVFLSSVPRMMQTSESNSRITNQVQAANEAQSKLDASLESSAEAAKIAEQRYSNGCLVVTSQQQPGKMTALTEGIPVTDPTSGNSLPAEVTVCDIYGGTGQTARTADGRIVVDRFAFTGNRAIVTDALKKQGFTFN